jgi:hypothetical protein
MIHAIEGARPSGSLAFARGSVSEMSNETMGARLRTSTVMFAEAIAP